MKKTPFLFFAIFLLGIYSCDKKENPPAPTITLTSETQNDKKIEPEKIEQGIQAVEEKKEPESQKGPFEKAGHEIKEGFKTTGHEIKKGSEKAGSEMKKGFEKAGHSIKDAFK